MLSPEDFMYVLTHKGVYRTLQVILSEDCYSEDFQDGFVLQHLLTLLKYYEILYIASDDRVLFTPKGEKLFQTISTAVENNKN